MVLTPFFENKSRIVLERALRNANSNHIMEIFGIELIKPGTHYIHGFS